MKLQQTLGSASIAYKESNFDGTLSKLEQLQQTIAEWRTTVVAKKAAGAVPVVPEKEPEPPAESVEFSMNQTHVPDKCKRQAEEGATMRVHYVGKLLTGSGSGPGPGSGSGFGVRRLGSRSGSASGLG